jgi:tRNA(Ile)-lysidine synthase
LQPLGSQHRRRLKDLFIDRRVQRSDRDRIPLLCLGEQVVWVPGVALHDAFRWRPGATRAWVAELTGLGPIGEGK